MSLDASRGLPPRERQVAAGSAFAFSLPFTSAGDVREVPMPNFACRVTGWRVRLNASGSATFAVKSAGTITGTPADLVGAGTAPSVSSALGAESSAGSSLNWTDTAIAAREVLEVTLSTLTTATRATLTLEFQRTA